MHVEKIPFPSYFNQGYTKKKKKTTRADDCTAGKRSSTCGLPQAYAAATEDASRLYGACNNSSELKSSTNVKNS